MSENNKQQSSWQGYAFNFFVGGKPHGKGRPRFDRRGHAYTPQATRDYEMKVREAARAEIKKLMAWPMDQHYDVRILAGFPIPNSWSKQKKELARNGELYPGKPDVDNLEKSILDALNGLAYSDDSQVIQLSISKYYVTEHAGVYVHVVISGE